MDGGLREEFALTAWFYDGQCLQDVGGRVRRTDDPWDEDGIVIVSRQLIIRSERRGSIPGGEPTLGCRGRRGACCHGAIFGNAA